MFLRRLRSFSSLAPAERALAVRALLWLGVMRIAIPWVRLPRLRRWIEGRPVTDGPPAFNARAVRRAMSRAERTWRGSTCLARAFAAELLLRAEGLRVGVSIGVSDGSTSVMPLDAHAWAESDGIIVSGDQDELDRYKVLITYRSPV